MIIWTDAGILMIRTSGANFNEILSEIKKNSIQINTLENVVCEMADILSRPQCEPKEPICAPSLHSRVHDVLYLGIIDIDMRS